MRYSDLIKEYRKLCSIRGPDLAQIGVIEKAVPIHETDRIRILLVRKPQKSSPVRLEVEITLPERIWGLNANLSSNKFSSPNQSELRLSLEEMIILFRYILNLQAAGFNLDFFSDEGVWIASYNLTKEPSKALFAQCKPPKLKVN
ncbi:MAG: hypothetical protein ACFFCF_09620 [Promethearchaeota archaeon]